MLTYQYVNMIFYDIIIVAERTFTCQIGDNFGCHSRPAAAGGIQIN
ncbi:MAG: hypothetical protein UV40_C0004G0004 [Parcubacteria group bacterium GW2011_GWA1_42_7]|nr:MAG: hypothetical protein UV34_C0046G0003 [Parcubacteria group bacterium GW2011_GWB1_42_6]KKS70131.1 MAG: hypothetical protein UV40_C0004G0004 [Parcubacteria group bacterium GW2011_GWA1_42_7]KKS91812.1 MAG: hypothetical protein UV67_C0017G0007 [Parcubacteria group bacterium GW2011_GWC1_43_12]